MPAGDPAGYLPNVRRSRKRHGEPEYQPRSKQGSKGLKGKKGFGLSLMGSAKFQPSSSSRKFFPRGKAPSSSAGSSPPSPTVQEHSEPIAGRFGKTSPTNDIPNMNDRPPRPAPTVQEHSEPIAGRFGKTSPTNDIPNMNDRPSRRALASAAALPPEARRRRKRGSGVYVPLKRGSINSPESSSSRYSKT